MLGWEDLLEKGKATHSSILAWRIPMDRGAWWATVHGATKPSGTRVKCNSTAVPSLAAAVQSIRGVPLFVTLWTTARQAPLSSTIFQSLFKLMSIESVMLSNHLIICCPLLLLPSIFPSIRVFSNEWVLCIMWPKYWSFSFSIVLPMSIQG